MSKSRAFPRLSFWCIWGFPEIRGTFWGPYNKDDNLLGSMLGSPFLGTTISGQVTIEGHLLGRQVPRPLKLGGSGALSK